MLTLQKAKMIFGLEVGQRIFNHGDSANIQHFGTIIDSDGLNVKIKVDESEKTYSVGKHAFSKKYLGHAGTRFVTEEAYNTYRQEQKRRFSVAAII